MKRFEYKTYSYTASWIGGWKFEKIEAELNKLGREGWEVVSSVQVQNIRLIYTLKREIY